jgi:16S rRNA G1207 methylase RsmC
MCFQPEQIIRAVDEALSQMGRIDILINGKASISTVLSSFFTKIPFE